MRIVDRKTYFERVYWALNGSLWTLILLRHWLPALCVLGLLLVFGLVDLWSRKRDLRTDTPVAAELNNG